MTTCTPPEVLYTIRDDPPSVNLDGGVNYSMGRSISPASFVNTESDIVLAIQQIFDQGISSIDFTNFQFKSGFSVFVDRARNCKSVTKITLTRSMFTEEQIQAFNELASERKGLTLVDSEGGFIGGVHTDWAKYYKEFFLEKAKLKDKPTLRETPGKALQIFEEIYHRLPAATVDFGAADGSNTIPLMLKGCKNIDAIDISVEQGDRFARRLFELKLSAEEFNVKYHLVECVNFDPETPAELLISNYVWPYRKPEDFNICWKKSIDCVATDGVMCGELFGKPNGVPRDGVTFHTLDEALDLLQESNLEVLYFEVEPHEVSMKRKDADTIPWGDLYRLVVKKTDSIQLGNSQKVKTALDIAKNQNKPCIYTVLETY